MDIARLILSLVFVAFAPTAMAERPVKTLVCHVSDEGNINLIEVANPAKHIGNESHAYGTEVDYAPPYSVAPGEGKEDSDGDGVDDGCERCPCWTEADLPPLDSSDCKWFEPDPNGQFYQAFVQDSRPPNNSYASVIINYPGVYVFAWCGVYFGSVSGSLPDISFEIEAEEAELPIAEFESCFIDLAARCP
jgi:hypothetical protein